MRSRRVHLGKYSLLFYFAFDANGRPDWFTLLHWKIVCAILKIQVRLWTHHRHHHHHHHHDDDDDDDDDDDVVLYSAVSSCYCSMLGAIGRVESFEALLPTGAT